MSNSIWRVIIYLLDELDWVKNILIRRNKTFIKKIWKFNRLVFVKICPIFDSLILGSKPPLYQLHTTPLISVLEHIGKAIHAQKEALE